MKKIMIQLKTDHWLRDVISRGNALSGLLVGMQENGDGTHDIWWNVPEGCDLSELETMEEELDAKWIGKPKDSG